MGTIQNAFNQVLGVAAGGISTAKLLHNQEQEKKISAVNLAESQENKAAQFNEDVKTYEKDVNQNMSDLSVARNKTVATMREFGPNSDETLLARKAFRESLGSYNKEVERLEGIREGLTTRKQLLEARKGLAEEILGENKLSHVKLSEIKNPNEQNEIKAKAIKSVQAYRHGGNK